MTFIKRQKFYYTGNLEYIVPRKFSPCYEINIEYWILNFEFIHVFWSLLCPSLHISIHKIVYSFIVYCKSGIFILFIYFCI